MLWKDEYPGTAPMMASTSSPRRSAATEENTACSGTPKPNTLLSPVVMKRRRPGGFGMSGSGPRIASELMRTVTPRS